MKNCNIMSDFRHPELQEGETLFTNANLRTFKWMKWKTKRRGIVPYDGNGKITAKGKSDFFPVFIKMQEIEDRGLILRDLRREVSFFMEMPQRVCR